MSGFAGWTGLKCFLVSTSLRYTARSPYFVLLCTLCFCLVPLPCTHLASILSPLSFVSPLVCVGFLLSKCDTLGTKTFGYIWLLSRLWWGGLGPRVWMVWVCGVSPFQSETCLFRVPKNLPASEVCSIESRTQPTFESPTPFVGVDARLGMPIS